ncbi:MAG: hypothetical protein II893_08150 [Methanomicrobium sp.]|nr:hypothetical protein [Methanomicrobium sp.]
MARRNDRSKQRSLAEERINRLFELAMEHAGTENAGGKDAEYGTDVTDGTFGTTCVKHARTLAMKYRIRIKKPYNRYFCRKCNSFFMPGRNVKTRIYRNKVIVTCENCGAIRRYPLPERKNND